MKITESTKREKKDGLGRARGALLFLFTFQVSSFSLVFGDTHYVDITSTNATAPYTNWATAAMVIQDAIDQAESNDTVRVADGVYSNGGVAVYGSMTNRVAINKAITVHSVNGAGVTAILGRGPVGDGAVRCAYVTNGAVLAGFTLTNGATRSSGDVAGECSGGGAWGEAGACVSNCVIAGNSASYYGGGSYAGRLYNCTLNGNTAYNGGGSYGASLYNCIVNGNSASWQGGGSFQGSLYNCAVNGNTAASDGGGSYGASLYNCALNGNSALCLGGGSCGGRLYNCIAYFNTAANGGNTYDAVLSNSCSTPLVSGMGNITNDPQWVSTWRIAATSPCRGKGNGAHATGADMDGEGWLTPPSMGCDEYVAGAVTGPLSVAIQADYTNLASGCVVGFRGSVGGRAGRSEWSYGDGGMESGSVLRASHGWSATGQYAVVLRVFNESWPAGVSATVRVSVVAAPDYYVNAGNPTPAPPYSSWATAATGIQDAVDAAIPGGVIRVTNGIYETGGRAVFGAMTNRVVLDKPVKVRSVNGPGVTVIRGRGPVGDGAVRCAYVGEGALLAGFTLTNGATLSGGVDLDRECSGGGAWCESGGVVSNCLMAGNTVYAYGGGSWGGTLYDCVLSGNTAAAGGGSLYGCLYGCALISNTASLYGGGSCYGILYNCTVTGNSALDSGGGSWGSGLYNCLLSGNTAPSGGGAWYCNMCNGTVSGNTASDSGGGTYAGTLYNCIVYFNAASSGPNCLGGALTYSCTTPSATGAGNITNAPQFMDTNAANYRLTLTSPCIDRGGNQDWMSDVTDLDGNPRVLNGTVDMGAYEVPFYVSPRVWLQGAFDTNQNRMTTGLQDHMPLKAPYKADTHGVAALPTNVTDWVLVQIRETNGQAIVSRSALLNRDGYVLADNGSTGVVVDVSPGTNGYLVLQHRNHLSVMSAQPLAFTNLLTTYDFTTNWTAYYGGSNGCVQLKPGAWGMIAGDADGDGKITETDRKIVEQQKGRTGYLPGDLNLDGSVE